MSGAVLLLADDVPPVPPATGSWLRNGTPGNSAGGTSAATATVPTGTALADYGLFTVSGDNSTPGTLSWTKNGSSITPTVAVTLTGSNNTYIQAVQITGLVPGDSIAVTPTTGNTMRVTHQYFTGLVTVGTLGNRNGASSADVVAPPMTVPGGSLVYAYSATRAFSTYSTSSNSNGRVLTQRYNNYDGTGPIVGVSLLEFTEPTTASGTTTITDTAASGNGVAFHLYAAAAPSTAPPPNFFAFL